MKPTTHPQQRGPAVAVTNATLAESASAAGVTAARLERLGLELAASLHSAIAGGPQFRSVGLIADPVAVTVAVQWQGPTTLTLVVRVHGDENVARVVGKGGGAIEALRSLLRRQAARHGLSCAVQVIEA